MNPQLRQKEIVGLLKSNPLISVTEMAKDFSVSVLTIRRDLIQLEKDGIVQRTRGGAFMNDQSEIAPAMQRMEINSEGKNRIARVAASMIQSGNTVILDAGSTTGRMPHYLDENKGITIITPSLYIAHELANTKFTMISPGGLLLNQQMVFIGPECENYFKNIEVDITFAAPTGLRLGKGFTTQSTLQYHIKCAMLSSGRKKVVLMDYMKFECSGLYVFADFSDVDCIITDREITDENILRSLTEQNIEVIIA